MQKLISLVYVSAARRLFTEYELAALLSTCRDNNAARNVTGMLCYVDGNFMQALEGEDTAVDDLTRRIANDSRHCGMRRLIRQPIAERQFDRWSMALRGIENLPAQDRAASAAFIAESVSGTPIAKPNVAAALIDSFRKTMLER